MAPRARELGEAKGEEKEDGVLLEKALERSRSRLDRPEEPNRRQEEVEEDGRGEDETFIKRILFFTPW